MTVTAAAFARLCGVSKVAVSKAPPTKIHKEPDGSVDTEHPTNALYLAQHQGGAAPAKKSAPAKVAKPKAPDPAEAAERAQLQKAVAKRQAKADKVPDDIAAALAELSPAERRKVKADAAEIEATMSELAGLPAKKMRADVALKEAMTKNHEAKFMLFKGSVITREEFRRIAEEWNAKLGQSVMRVPRRVISRLWAMAKAGDEARDGEAYLEKALSAAVTRALEGVAKGGHGAHQA